MEHLYLDASRVQFISHIVDGKIDYARPDVLGYQQETARRNRFRLACRVVVVGGLSNSRSVLCRLTALFVKIDNHDEPRLETYHRASHDVPQALNALCTRTGTEAL